MTKRVTHIEELYERHKAEDGALFKRYHSNMRAACLRPGGRVRYKRENRYFERRNQRGTPLLGRVFHHLVEDLYCTGRVYTVRNGKVVAIRDKPHPRQCL